MTKMEVGWHPLSRVRDFLQDDSQIGMLHTRCVKHGRCVSLCLQTVFDKLVSLYIPLFQCQWQHFKCLMKKFAPPLGVPPWIHATRAYISAWIHDLYVSNHKAVQTLSYSEFQQHYSHGGVYYSLKYDEFLIHLNAAIRPTHIKGTMEDDTLYIPILSDNPSWDTDNPFKIENFVLNYDLVSGIIANLKGWRMSTIVSGNLGRPTWLFDWHEDNKCCAWFPLEGNYTMDDVSIAYIVGAACTPNLGPRDVDDWQNGSVPENSNPLDYDRAVDRRFYGAYEVRTVERRNIHLTVIEETVQGPPTDGKKTATESMTGTSKAAASNVKQQDAQQLMVRQFQLIDWTYYSLVILNLEPGTRSRALWLMVQNSDFNF